MELLTDRDVRRDYGMRSLPQWRVSGKGPPFVKLGKRVYYDRSAVEAWIRAQQRTSTSDPGKKAA